MRSLERVDAPLALKSAPGNQLVYLYFCQQNHQEAVDLDSYLCLFMKRQAAPRGRIKQGFAGVPSRSQEQS